MLFKQSSGYPLINRISDVINQFLHTGLIFLLSSLYGLEEELNEGFQRVLIHMINNAQRNTQEVQHGTLGGHRTIDLSLGIDVYFCLFCLL